MLSPDTPIKSAAEDLLGRTSFAAALARAIAGIADAENFVVGLHGKWGTGKSSVLNLVVEQIERLNRSAKSDEEKLYTMRFNPWNFSEQNQLVFQFLKQFRAHLVKFEPTAKKRVRQIIDSLDEYTDALKPPLALIPYAGNILSGGIGLAFHGAQKRFGSPKEIGDIFQQFPRLTPREDWGTNPSNAGARVTYQVLGTKTEGEVPGLKAGPTFKSKRQK